MTNTSRLSPDEIRARMNELTPGIPWAHHFDFGAGIETVTPEDEKFHAKAIGLKKIGQLIMTVVREELGQRTIDAARVLDIACAEGEHSISLARAGAEVVGIEGRDLYLERARFAAEVLGVSDRTTFVKGDVREMNPEQLGTFDLVIASGILHHLNVEAFETFLGSVYALTRDIAVIYTHVSTDFARANHRLDGPVESASGYRGYLFREHADDATDQQKMNKVRASLDNPQSFWAEKGELMRALEATGFRTVMQVMKPHVFSRFDQADYRPILICRR